MNKQTIIVAVIVIVVGAGAFFGGMKYQQLQAAAASISTQGQFGNRFGGRFGGMGMGGNARFGAPTAGTIVRVQDGTITVQLSDGSSKLIILNNSTKIVKTQVAKSTDLTEGTKVAIFGTTNADGSINAQNIQINPQFRQRVSLTPTK